MTTKTEKMPNLPKIPMGWKWIAATVISTVIVVALLVSVYYPNIPDPMPTHWNVAGEADAFTAKTLGGFLGLILLGPGILILTMLGAEAMISMQSGHVTGPGGAKTPDEAHRTWLGYEAMMQNLGWFMFALNLIVMIMLVRSYSGAQQHPVEFTAMLILIFALCGVLMWVQLKQQKDAQKKYPMPAEEKAKWWGIFYNDPEDKRIMVDTGTGSNFTFNIGQTGGKVAAGILLGAPLLFVVWALFQAF